MGGMNDVDLVVLVDAQGNPTGTAPKSTVHTHDTPLHLAFSCYVLGSDGKILVTRRSLSKKTWPGVWTNSACGHLLPNETSAEAAIRRVPHEIGLSRGELKNLECVLPDFRYRAIDSQGTVEWEICPVFIAYIDDPLLLQPRPDEIDSLAWMKPEDLFNAVDAAPFAFSPWMVEQLEHEELRHKLIGT